MFKSICKKISVVLLAGAMLCSGIGMLSASAAEEKFVDDCNDLSKVFDSMKQDGESVWEVIECPYVEGEKFLQRKELTPDPFGGWLVYGREGSTIKDFKLTMNNFKFDYTPQVKVYVSADNKDYAEIQINTSALVEIGGKDYPDGARDVTSTFEITPKDALPADTAYVKLETLRENYGLGLRKAEITYANSGEKPNENPEEKPNENPEEKPNENLRVNFKDDFSEEYAKTSEHSEGLAITPNPDLKLDYLLGKTAPEAQYITYKLEDCLDVTDGISFKLEAYSVTKMDKAVNNLFAYVSDDGTNWTKVEMKSTEQAVVSGQEYWEGCTLSGSYKGSPKFLKIEFKENMDPNWLACLASVTITGSTTPSPATGEAFPSAAILLAAVAAVAFVVTKKLRVSD